MVWWGGWGGGEAGVYKSCEERMDGMEKAIVWIDGERVVWVNWSVLLLLGVFTWIAVWLRQRNARMRRNILGLELEVEASLSRVQRAEERLVQKSDKIAAVLEENRQLREELEELKGEKHVWDSWKQAQKRTGTTAKIHNLNEVNRTPEAEVNLLQKSRDRLQRTKFLEVSPSTPLRRESSAASSELSVDDFRGLRSSSSHYHTNSERDILSFAQLEALEQGAKIPGMHAVLQPEAPGSSKLAWKGSK